MENKERQEFLTNKNNNKMKKVHAWWLVVEQDAKTLANSPTTKEDIATLKSDFIAMMPDLFNEAEAVLAKILLAAL